jgi:hypothetical protein
MGVAEQKPLTTREALLLVLDQVDYTKGACGLFEMVGACLPAEVIDRARQALAAGVNASVPAEPEVTEAMKQAGVRELFAADLGPKPDAWEEKIARVYIAMRNAGVQAVADPCPQCRQGIVCKKPTCGRLAGAQRADGVLAVDAETKPQEPPMPGAA